MQAITCEGGLTLAIEGEDQKFSSKFYSTKCVRYLIFVTFSMLKENKNKFFSRHLRGHKCAERLQVTWKTPLIFNENSP